MAKGRDLREELGLEFKIDDFIRRHMSDMQLPEREEVSRLPPKPPRAKERPPAPQPRNFSAFEALLQSSAATPEKPPVSEPQLRELECYRPAKPTEVSVSVPVSLSNSCLASPTARRLEVTQPQPTFRPQVQSQVVETPVAQPKKTRNPLDLPDLPPFLMILGVGGVCVRVQNNEDDYSHKITINNVKSDLDSPQIRTLRDFPGPLEPGSPIAPLFNYCTARGRESVVWEVLRWQLTTGVSLLEESDSEEVRAARVGVLECLQRVLRPVQPVLSPFASESVDWEAMQQSAELLKRGRLEEALTHALGTRKRTGRTVDAGLSCGWTHDVQSGLSQGAVSLRSPDILS